MSDPPEIIWERKSCSGLVLLWPLYQQWQLYLPEARRIPWGGGEWIREKAGWASTGGGWICPVCPVATRRYVFSEGRDERREVENFQVRWQFETCQIGRPTLPDLRCLSRACGMAELLLSLTLNVIWRGLHYPTWVSSTTSSIQSTPQICFLNIL